ncbi:MAG: DUF6605 domain-containing protein [Burkholderiaceae bacterium]
MLPLAAYADRLSVRPGQTIHFHVASATGADTHIELVRVISADANPNGPGIVLAPLSVAPDTIRQPSAQAVPYGSYAVVPALPPTLGGHSTTIACRVLPTAFGRERTLLHHHDGESGWSLGFDEHGALIACVNGLRLRTQQALKAGVWAFVWLRIDVDGPQASIGHRALHLGLPDDRPGARQDRASSAIDAPAPIAPGTPMHIGCGIPERHDHFSGRVEQPTLFAGALGDIALNALANGESAVLEQAIAHWDLAREPGSSRIVDVGPHGCHGRLVNSPTRAVTGSRWSGREMRWRDAPADYAAIHFHDDDLSDCQWPACYAWQVPEGTRSAVYALRLRSGAHEENVPFFVVPPKGKATAPIAVLASTFTYTVYGNNVRPEWDRDPTWQQGWRDQSAAWGAYPANPGDHREYGLSTYDLHTDGSGIGIASWHRPMLNVRIGYITYPDEPLRASGLRHFPADTHLIAWLDKHGHEVDIISDQELHDEGVSLLSRYRVLMTGSHPEYHTRPMIDAITQFRDRGGRLIYLGGNGFYWKIALDPERDGIIEIRRAEGGIRAWAAEPGEYYHQFDGEYGGLWRRNGRPPQQLAGVGFTAQGNFLGSYYRRCAAADDPRAAWIFAGVDDEIIGRHGLSGHGAAGFELDRADPALGTPEHALVLARSENHPPEAPWILVPEEMLTHLLTVPRVPARELIHADMTFFETAGGGAVFSTGSITFCGSLVTNGFDNDCSRILDNVVRRFADAAPFEPPSR